MKQSIVLDGAVHVVMMVSHAKTVELIEMPLGQLTRVGPMHHVLDGVKVG